MDVSEIIKEIVEALGYDFTEGSSEYVNATLNTFDLQNKSLVYVTPIVEQGNYSSGVQSEASINAVIGLAVKNDGIYQANLDESYIEKRERRLKNMKINLKTLLKKIGCNEKLQFTSHRIFTEINQFSENVDILMAEVNFIYYE